MSDYRFWVGPLGSLLPLPDVMTNIDASAARIGGVHTSLAGVQTVDTFGFKQSWSWSWDYLLPTQVAYVKALALNMVAGPLRLIDPREANRLPQQVASGGSQRRSTENFAVDGGGLTYRSLRDLTANRSTLPAAPLLRGAQQLSLPSSGSFEMYTAATDTSDGRWQTPLLAGEQVTCSAWVSGATGNTVALRYRLLHVDGTTITLTGPPVSVRPLQWLPIRATLTPPPTAISLSMGLAVTATATSSIYTTAWQHAAVDPEPIDPHVTIACPMPDPSGGWRPGGGAPVVVVGDSKLTYTLPGFSTAALTLLET